MPGSERVVIDGAGMLIGKCRRERTRQTGSRIARRVDSLAAACHCTVLLSMSEESAQSPAPRSAAGGQPNFRLYSRLN